MSRTRIGAVPVSILFLVSLFVPLAASGNEGPDAALASNMRPLYWSCVDGMCEPTTAPGRDGDDTVLLGYIKESAGPGTLPLHWTCVALIHLGGCRYQALVAQPRYDDSLLLGYIHMEPQPGTIALYWSCKQRDPHGECADLAPDNGDGSLEDSILLGYVYSPWFPGQIPD